MVDQGLAPGDRVVVTGQLGVTPGGEIRIEELAPAASPRGGRRGRDRRSPHGMKKRRPPPESRRSQPPGVLRLFPSRRPYRRVPLAAGVARRTPSRATIRPDFITHVRGGWTAIASGTQLAATAQRSAGAPAVRP